jgi:hypothetical protein
VGKRDARPSRPISFRYFERRLTRRSLKGLFAVLDPGVSPEAECVARVSNIGHF